MRILFTGGTGKAGRHVIPYLVERGHYVLNIDLKPLDHPGVNTLIADITDSGQMFNAMSMHGDFAELAEGDGRVKGFDAVVHFAAVPRILIHPDNETFRINTVGTYNVIEAALKMGVRKIIFASSETTYGVCFAQGPRKPDYLPVDEDHPVVPEDSYAMSKVANEVTARSFQRRTGADIYGIRINNVIEPHEYAENFPAYFADPALRERNIFAYIDARDLGHMVDRMLNVDGLGFEIFNASNDNHSVNLSSAELIERFYDGVPVKREIPGEQTFYSNEKARRLLGFAPKHNWRDVLDG